MTTKTQADDNRADALNEREQQRINHGVLLQALRETLHASNAETTLSAARLAEIEVLCADPTAKDEVLLQALREMLAFIKGSDQLTEVRGEQIFHLANVGGPIEDILANDENSSDEELIDHLVSAFEMRRVEAVEHIKRRDYLQRYLLPVKARK